MPSEYSGRWVRTKPKRPYRSLAEFRDRTLWTSGARKFFSENRNRWPCLACQGIGTIYDPNDPPCPVEGNKLRNRIACPKCGGSRCIDKREFSAAYHEAINEYLKEKDEYESLVKAKKVAIKKLTDREVQALRVLGV